MALKGNLRDFSVTQLLNLVNVAHKTGTLVVERSQEQIYVSFREGKLSFARNGTDAAGLTSVLYHARKLNAAQVRAINERSTGMSDKELGLLLINSNYISQQEIIASLQTYYMSMVNRLFNWSEGLFHFDAELLPPLDKITVRLSLENLIIEGTRKMRELEQLLGEIPSLDMALKFTNRPGINMRSLSLSADEWKVISFINPKNTINQIARATNKNDQEIRRIVFSFIQAGLVEMVRPEGVPVLRPAPPVQPALVQTSKPIQTEQPVPTVQTIQSSQPVKTVESISQAPPTVTPIQGSKPEFKSLINRIINRIRSI